MSKETKIMTRSFTDPELAKQLATSLINLGVQFTFSSNPIEISYPINAGHKQQAEEQPRLA